MLQKKEIELVFDVKRNRKIVTPCCNKSNTDGKFANYKNLNEKFGYCHSCAKATLPPSIYIDENGNQYYWNDLENRFEAISLTVINKPIREPKLSSTSKLIIQKYIDESIIWKYFKVNPENNLLQYLRKRYGDSKTEDAKETYALGTSKDEGIIFWSINSNLKVQKAKIAYYDTNGKRTNTFKVPYKK